MLGHILSFGNRLKRKHSNIKPFINKYKWKGINPPSKKYDWKTFEKIIWQVILIFCILKKMEYVQFMSQKLIPILKDK